MQEGAGASGDGAEMNRRDVLKAAMASILAGIPEKQFALYKPVAGAKLPSYVFDAGQLEHVGDRPAVLERDEKSLVRKFDDTDQEAVGFTLYQPHSSWLWLGLVINASHGSGHVVMELSSRESGVWNAGDRQRFLVTERPTIKLMAFQPRKNETNVHQFLLTRKPGPSDTLRGDLKMHYITADWT